MFSSPFICKRKKKDSLGFLSYNNVNSTASLLGVTNQNTYSSQIHKFGEVSMQIMGSRPGKPLFKFDKLLLCENTGTVARLLSFQRSQKYGFL